eukprot:151318_1
MENININVLNDKNNHKSKENNTKHTKGTILEPEELDLHIENIKKRFLNHKIANNTNKYPFDVKGTFEYHITVKIKNKEDVNKFVNYCKEIDIKPIFIELPYGGQIKQLMTSKYLTGIYPNILPRVYSTAYKLRNKGFEILRVKIESLACNKGVPIYDNDIQYEAPMRYFEFHFKVLLSNKNEKLKLMKLGKKYNAHTSRNSFKSFENGKFINFLTMRTFNKGSINALKEFSILKNDLIKNKFEIIGTEKEYAVYDSNLELDNGWVKKINNEININKLMRFMTNNA